MILIFFTQACKKSANDQKKITIEGFQFFDALGNPLARIGPADNDWLFVNWSSLSSFEQSLLNSADNVNTNNTSVSSVFISPYPNPVTNISAIFLNSGDSVKFKLAIVDQSGTILKQFTLKIKGASPIQIDLSDRNLFPQKKSLRYYYSFSATNNLNFKVGYGDIKVCDYQPGQDPIEDCFK